MADDLKQTDSLQKQAPKDNFQFPTGQAPPTAPIKSTNNNFKNDSANTPEIPPKTIVNVAPTKKPVIPLFPIPPKFAIAPRPMPPKPIIPSQPKPIIPPRPITLKPIDPITPSQPKQTVPLWQMPPKPLIKPNTLIQPKEKPIIAQNPPINILKPETPKQKIYTDIPNDTPIEPGIAKSNRKKILIAVITAIIVIFGAGGYYWSMNLLSTPSIVEKEKPASLISVHSDEVINIEKNATFQTVWQIISGLLERQYPDGFTRILIKTSRINAESDTTAIAYGNFSEFVKNNLGIYFPDYIINATNNFTFFINTDDNNNKLGIIIEMNDSAIPNNTANVLKLWEEDSMINDLASLVFLTPENISAIPPDTASFNSNQYKNIDIRYINFKGSNRSIDYMFLKPQNFLIITTSKNSTYNTINNILDSE